MDVLILHGYLGNSPEHWQTWLAGRLEGARYPELPDPEHPRLERGWRRSTRCARRTGTSSCATR